jgi:PHD/YefM family antitoxin component YafN of YafNO toxin-antitoxin module
LLGDNLLYGVLKTPIVYQNKLWYNNTIERSVIMPKIIPIKDLKNTSEISALCHSSSEPVYITKNGYGDMVIMSIEEYEKRMFLRDMEIKLAEAEEELKRGEYEDADTVLEELRLEYGL